MTWKRARTPQQISERRQAIIEAAGQLFAVHEYHEVTFMAIALRAGIAKSNIYRYFESKEAIFVHIFLSELDDWARLLRQHVAGVAPGDVTGFAAAMVQSAVAVPRFLELQALLAGVLERNLSVELAVSFKKDLMARLDGIVCACEPVFPGLPSSRRMQLFMLMHALVAGLYPAQAVSQRLTPHLAGAGVQYPAEDFPTTLQTALELLLHGMLKEETHAR